MLKFLFVAVACLLTATPASAEEVSLQIGSSFWEVAAQVATVANATLILLALVQLRQGRRVATASLLIELNNQFDNADMLEARSLLIRRTEEVKRNIQNDLTIAGIIPSDADIKERVPEYFAKHLNKLRAAGPTTVKANEFKAFIALFGFFETAGAMARRNYLPLTLVLEVFSGPAADACLAMRDWVDQKQKEPGMLPGLLSNALWLGGKAMEPKGLMKWFRR